MIISKVNTIAFGNGIHKAKENYDNSDVNGKDVAVGAVAGGGSAAVVGKMAKNAINPNGAANAALKTGEVLGKVGKVASKGQRTVEGTVGMFNRTKSWFLGLFKAAEKTKMLKPLAKMAKWAPVRWVGGAFGFVTASAFCITDGLNIVNTTVKFFDNKK